MKENKKFFDNNRLNKGYKHVGNSRQSDSNLIRKKYKHVLPPIDMMEEYEELNPGTFEKLFDMAEREQNHRHSLDLMAMEKHNRATKLGRVFALIFVALVSVTTLMLVIAKSIVSASVFAVSSFACISIVSYFYSRNSINKEVSRYKSPRYKDRNYRNSRNSPRSNQKREILRK